MPRPTKPPLAPELEAFCPTCPPVEEVSALLATLGFRLAFQMEVRNDLSTLVHLPALPAQYHYKDDAHGTEVIYLAGRDTALEGEVFPIHASRFWLSPGATNALGSYPYSPSYTGLFLRIVINHLWLERKVVLTADAMVHKSHRQVQKEVLACSLLLERVTERVRARETCNHRPKATPGSIVLSAVATACPG